MTRPTKAHVQMFRCSLKYSISASVLIGNARTSTYCERMKPNMGRLNAVRIEAKNPVTAIHLGL